MLIQWSSVHTSRKTMCRLCVCWYGLVDALPTAKTEQVLNEFIRLHRHMFDYYISIICTQSGFFPPFEDAGDLIIRRVTVKYVFIKSQTVNCYVVASCFFGVMISLYFVSWCLSSYSNLPRWRSIESGTPRMKNSPERYSRVS